MSTLRRKHLVFSLRHSFFFFFYSFTVQPEYCKMNVYSNNHYCTHFPAVLWLTFLSLSLSSFLIFFSLFFFFTPLSTTFTEHNSELRRASITSRQLDMSIKLLQIRGCKFIKEQVCFKNQTSRYDAEKFTLSKDFTILLHQMNSSILLASFDRKHCLYVTRKRIVRIYISTQSSIYLYLFCTIDTIHVHSFPSNCTCSHNNI